VHSFQNLEHFFPVFMVDSLVKFGVDFKSEDEIALTVLILEISGSLDAGIACLVLLKYFSRRLTFMLKSY